MRFDRAGPYLDAHCLQVVQRFQKTSQIASISQLVTRDIMFKHRAVDVVVCWVAIHKPVQEQSVEGEAPIFR